MVAFDAVPMALPFNFKVRAEDAAATPVILIVPPTLTLIGSIQGMYLGSKGGRLSRTAYSELP